MSDLLINGTTYSGVTQVQIPLASGSGNAKFVEDNDALGELLLNTLTEYSNDEVTTLSIYSFYQRTSLVKAIFPNVTAVHDEAFAKCSNLETVDLSSCTSIGANVFHTCSKLKNISLGAFTRLNRQLFMNCTSLENFESLTADNIFNDSIFSGCTSLKTVSLPNLKSVSGGMTFYNCTALTDVDFGFANKINVNTFYGCTSLENITLKATTMTILANINAFDNCGGKTINIHVPENLIATYQADATWSAVTGATLNFVALS